MFNCCPFCGKEIPRQTKNGFQCPNCNKWTHYASNPAVSIAVRVGNEALVAVRGIDPGKGMDDLVGGFLEYGEDPLIGAVREFKEETGFEIDKNKLKLLGLWIGDYQDVTQLILNIVYLLELSDKPKVFSADDVADLIWVPLSSSPNFAFFYLHQVWAKINTHQVCAE